MSEKLRYFSKVLLDAFSCCVEKFICEKIMMKSTFFSLLSVSGAIPGVAELEATK